MIDVYSWMNELVKALEFKFADRLWFVGLQGSYARGEATDKSDIDAVVILDEVTASDIEAYSKILDTLPYRELACGFFSGKNELFNWEPSDLLSLYYDTKPIKGSLDDLIEIIDEEAVNRAIKIGACNIYHGCVHNMIYDKSEEILTGLYKSATFVIQAICFKETGEYVQYKHVCVSEEDSAITEEQAITNTFLALKNGENVDFEKASRALFNWSKKMISL